MNILDRIEGLIGALGQRGVADGEIASTVKKLIHSPALALFVKLTPNKADDAVLDVLKGLFPAS